MWLMKVEVYLLYMYKYFG